MRPGPGPAAPGPARSPALSKDTEIGVASTGGGCIATMQRRMLRLALWSKRLRRPQGILDFWGISRAWIAHWMPKKPRSCLPREAASFIRLAASRTNGLGRELGWAQA